MATMLMWTWADGAPPQTLTFDLTESEDHKLDATVTDHAVERGANVADNVRPELDEVTVNVFISNAPLDADNAITGQVTSLAPYLPMRAPIIPPTPVTLDVPQWERPFPGVGFQVAGVALLVAGLPPTPPPIGVTVNTLTFLGPFDAVRDALTDLVRIKDTPRLVQVTTPQKTYDSMAITSIGMSRDKDTGTGAKLSIKFKQVRLVATQIVTAPAGLPRAGSMVSKGTQVPKDSDKVPEKTSLLKAGLKWLGK